MRLFLPLIASLALLLGVIQSAQATGNVLVPSNNDSAKPLPELGFTPIPAPAPQPPAPVIQPTPQPTAPKSIPPQTPTQSNIIQVPEQLPTTEILPGAVLPLSIDVDGRWVPIETRVITNSLGIPPNQIPANCQPMIMGIAMADKVPATFVVDGSLHAEAKYDGKIMGLTLSKGALCNANGAHPSQQGVIVQMGNKYMIPLGNGLCRLPENITSPRRIRITTADDGSLQCRF
jgi:hypothetical protein